MNNSFDFRSVYFATTFNSEILIITPKKQIFMRDEASEFGEIINISRKNGISKFIVVLNQCDYISSEGLGIISSSWNKCHDNENSQMCIVISREKDSEIGNLFDITGLSRTLGSTIQPNVDDAVKYIKNFSEDN